MKNLFTILFSFLFSIYSIGCDSSNSSTNSSDCPFLNQSLGCDSICAENPLQNDDCNICGGNQIDGDINGDGNICETECTENLDCNGDCGGSATTDACGICDGDGSTCAGLWNVYYDVSVPIAGFQFKVNGGTILNTSGGAAAESGLSVTNSSSTILAFSFTGSTIPPGTGTLISLEITGDSDSFCISDLILSDVGGNLIDATINNCNNIKF